MIGTSIYHAEVARNKIEYITFEKDCDLKENIDPSFQYNLLNPL